MTRAIAYYHRAYVISDDAMMNLNNWGYVSDGVVILFVSRIPIPKYWWFGPYCWTRAYTTPAE